jgi:hypothetical protein
VEDLEIFDPPVGFTIKDLFIGSVEGFEMFQRRLIIQFSFIDLDQALMDQGDIGERIYPFRGLQGQADLFFGLVEPAAGLVDAADL